MSFVEEDVTRAKTQRKWPPGAGHPAKAQSPEKGAPSNASILDTILSPESEFQSRRV